jgi:5-methylcytosine-specific restriction protein A
LAKSPLDHLYKTQRWKNVRALHIKKIPTCARCGSFGRVAVAQVVDHHPPCGDDVAAFWDPKRYRSLCTRCHGQVRGEQARGFSSAVDVTGKPTDPLHPVNAVRRDLPPLADDGDDLTTVSDLEPCAPRAREPAPAGQLPAHLRAMLERQKAWK